VYVHFFHVYLSFPINRSGPSDDSSGGGLGTCAVAGG
jgi:hypothetical protein